MSRERMRCHQEERELHVHVKREEKTEGWFELVQFGPKQEEESELCLLAEKYTSWAAIHDEMIEWVSIGLTQIEMNLVRNKTTKKRKEERSSHSIEIDLEFHKRMEGKGTSRHEVTRTS
jgi:hypothetical protein